MEIKIEHDAEGKKFYCLLGSGEAYLDYEKTGPGELNFYHTYVPPEFRNRGIASELLTAAANYARENGYRVYPGCSYALYYFREHKELDGIWIK